MLQRALANGTTKPAASTAGSPRSTMTGDPTHHTGHTTPELLKHRP